MDAAARMKELIPLLNEAAKAYYQGEEEIMSNYEYDRLYDELLQLEQESGMVLAGSPTHKVGYEVVSELPKKSHVRRMLSLNKTKSREDLAAFLGPREGLLSWKMDGLTVVLTYQNGTLLEAVTRGNGEVGEIITANARTFLNLPARIPFAGTLTLRGEAVISYADFEEINASLGEEAEKYRNPRNLCSGSVRQLNSRITAGRRVRFFAFSLVEAEGKTFTLHSEEMAWLSSLGFETVFFRRVTGDTVVEAVRHFAAEIENNPIPSDGLVLLLDDIAYGASLGTTAKFPRDALAFKWADELAVTHLREIEWSASRTGLINPVAVFDPVQLEGTTVQRASLHNLSMIEELKLALGDEITVYKANMIIPLIGENRTQSGPEAPPSVCPVCGRAAVVRDRDGVRTLHCTYEACPAKEIKKYALFASREGLGLEGLSEATLEKLIDCGVIRCYADFFRLEGHRDKVTQMKGFGDKSFDALLRAADAAARTTLPQLIAALGIPGVGTANAKVLCSACGDDLLRLKSASEEELQEVEGIGAVLSRGIRAYFDSEENERQLSELLPYLTVEKRQKRGGGPLEGRTVVITGSLQHFPNRDALKSRIEEAGGKVAGSVSSKTDYLVNNDLTSSSGKNKKARELGIPVISEEEMLAMLE